MGKSAFGTTLSVTIGAVLTPIAELTNIDGVAVEADDIDTTTHNSADGYRTYEQGLRDGGSVEIEGIFINDASQIGLKTLFDSGALVACEIGFPAGLAHWEFNAYVKALSNGAPIDDRLSFAATLKVSGKPTLSTGA